MQVLEIISILGEQAITEKLKMASLLCSLLETLVFIDLCLYSNLSKILLHSL